MSRLSDSPILYKPDERDPEPAAPPSYEETMAAGPHPPHSAQPVQMAAVTHNLTSSTTPFARGNLPEKQTEAAPKKGARAVCSALFKSADTMIRDHYITSKRPGLITSLYAHASDLARSGPSNIRQDRFMAQRSLEQGPCYDPRHGHPGLDLRNGHPGFDPRNGNICHDPRNADLCCDSSKQCRKCQREERHENRRRHRDCRG